MYLSINEMSQDYAFLSISHALCAVIGLNGHDLCQLGPLPTPVGTGASVQLNPGLLVHAWALLYEYQSSAQLQPCLYITTDVDPDPNSQTDFPV